MVCHLVGCPNLIGFSKKQRFYFAVHITNSLWNLASCLIKGKILKKNDTYFLTLALISKLLFEFLVGGVFHLFVCWFFFYVLQLDYKNGTWEHNAFYPFIHSFIFKYLLSQTMC